MNKSNTEPNTKSCYTSQCAARAAGQIIREGWGKPHAIQFKGAINLVTDIDRAAEKIILEQLRTATPEFDILTEESGAMEKGFTFRWVIDPLDGTTNYAHHFPYFSVSIGLEKDGESVIGVVHDPILEQMFSAIRGGGAFLNETPGLSKSCLNIERKRCGDRIGTRCGNRSAAFPKL